MIGLSTCFFSQKNIHGQEILEQTKKLGCSYLELEYRISKEMFMEIKNYKHMYDIEIRSLHNFSFRPEEIPEEKADADFYNLSSMDIDERNQAISYTIQTIENANSIEAPYVVLHLGDTGQQKERDAFHHLANSTKWNPKEHIFFNDYSHERARLSQKSFDATRSSLDSLISIAEKENICLCIENRYYTHQIPNFEEIGTLLNEFKGAPIGVWLDFGHAYVQGLWGLPGLDDYIQQYDYAIKGIHLHDAKGSKDHLPPGQGDIHFEKHIQFLKKKVIILEINKRHSDGELQEGINIFNKIIQ